MTKTWLPDYSDKIPTIKFIDPLGIFLTGKVDAEPVEYGFDDVVKQSGHSCPTIAGAYGLVYEAMSYLYEDGEIPVRGMIGVECPGSPEEGGMGPLSQAIGYLTGACAENGFQGLAGNFVRRGLLTFNGRDMSQSGFKFTRQDTKATVTLRYNSGLIPGDPNMGPLMQKALYGEATDDELREFGRLWQQRVAYVLVNEENRKSLFEKLPA